MMVCILVKLELNNDMLFSREIQKAVTYNRTWNYS